jgi:hypothetical protein
MNAWSVNYLEEAAEENVIEMLDQYEAFLSGNEKER